MADAAQPTHPLDGVDDLGEAVLLGLSRPVGWRQAPRPMRSGVLGVVSLGFLPILDWQPLLKQFATLEQQQLVHLAEWVRKSGRVQEGDALSQVAGRVRVSSVIRGWIYTLIFCSAVVLGGYFWSVGVHTLLVHKAARLFGRADKAHTFFVGAALSTSLLAVAFFLHWMQVTAYNQSARRFETLFFYSLGHADEELPAHVAKMRSLKRDNRWMALCLLIPFGPFMAMAGELQARVILVESRVRRARLAVRLRALMMTDRPAISVPVPMPLRRRCKNDLCEATLQESSHFCPRCGNAA
jgi:hypothetical protein